VLNIGTAMPRPILVAALLGQASAARVSKRRAHSGATSYVGDVPVFNEASSSERFNVYFGPKATDAMLEEFCAGNCEFRGHPDAGGVPFVVMKGDGMMRQQVSAYQAAVQAVEKDGEMVDDEAYESEVTAASWGVSRVGAENVPGRNGAGVNIYVLDSGVRVTHQDFGGRAIPTLDVVGLPPTVCAPDDTSCARDGRGHGSHVAGSAGGTTFGVAPAATIRACQRGGGFSDAFAAMDWIAVNHIKPAVLTMSFGTDSQVAGAAAALDAVVDMGVPVTVSAGNSNIDACRKTWSFVPSSIGVGSSTSNDERSSFSNWGDCVTLFAPGSSITSAHYTSDTGSRTISGTSMATPHVAGGVALLLAEDPSLSPAKVKERLIERAELGAITDLKGSPNRLLNVREPYTGPPTPAPPTPAPPPPGTWELTGTGCAMDGNCISSMNYPSNYGNNEECRVELYGDIPISIEAFSTESRYDYLRIGGSSYSGTSGPSSGSYTGTISWSSDYSVTRSGWRLCRTD